MKITIDVNERNPKNFMEIAQFLHWVEETAKDDTLNFNLMKCKDDNENEGLSLIVTKKEEDDIANKPILAIVEESEESNENSK